jgi:hypothetical protein
MFTRQIMLSWLVSLAVLGGAASVFAAELNDVIGG